MISLKPELVKEIAEMLDCGFKCYVHKETHELITIPDELKHPDMEFEAWEEDIEKLEENFFDYLYIEAMDSRESFSVMEDFIDEVDDKKLKNRLIYALERSKPFKNFKYEIDYSGKYREQWFTFKLQKNIEWVKDRITSFNSSLEMEGDEKADDNDEQESGN